MINEDKILVANKLLRKILHSILHPIELAYTNNIFPTLITDNFFLIVVCSKDREISTKESKNPEEME